MGEDKASVGMVPKVKNDIFLDLDPPAEFKEWTDYREFVRKVRCVVCQIVDEKDTKVVDGQEVRFDYEPALVDVSDPHHVVSRGAGGPDAENIVPLCRYHHSEFGNIGIAQFEVNYNLSLKAVAKQLFAMYMELLAKTDRSRIAYADHQLLISRMYDIHVAHKDLGRMLIKFKDELIDGKPRFEYLGFKSFRDYTEAPIDSGGLGLGSQAAYRCIWFAEAAKFNVEGAPDVEQIGASKTLIVLPMLKKAGTEEEKKEILTAASSLRKQDLITWKHERQGTEDPRQRIIDLIVKRIREFVIEHGGSMPDKNDCIMFANSMITRIKYSGQRDSEDSE